MKRSAGLAILLSLFAGTAAGAATAPAAKLPPSETALMGKPFVLDFYNFTVRAVTWLPDSSPAMQKVGRSSDEGKGSLVITADIKNSSDHSSSAPDNVMQAIFKDGSATGEDSSTAYTTTWKPLAGSYEPGDGTTAYFVVANVEKPTAENPITKLVLHASYSGTKPELVRLLTPPVAVGVEPAR